MSPGRQFLIYKCIVLIEKFVSIWRVCRSGGRSKNVGVQDSNQLSISVSVTDQGKFFTMSTEFDEKKNQIEALIALITKMALIFT